MSDANYPDDLQYIEEHDWARVEGDTATFGITWYAQDTLGLGQCRPDVKRAVEAEALGDVGEQLLDRRHADRLQHLVAIRCCE